MMTNSRSLRVDALLTYAGVYDCPGIEIEPGVVSGCNAAQTGATDCPTCQVVQEALNG